MARKSNVYKDKKGWYYKASLGKDKLTGKRKTKTKRGFKTQREAVLAYRQFIVEYENKKTIEKSEETIESIEFKHFLDNLFLPWYSNQVKKNSYNTKIRSELPKLSCFFYKKMNEITTIDVQLFQNELIKKGLSGNYINAITSFASVIWDRAKVFDFVSFNPFRKVGRVKVEKKKISFWTIEDFKKFEREIYGSALKNKVLEMEDLDRDEYVDFFNYLCFRFIFFTGLRVGELVTLLWENVNLENGTIKVLFTLGNVAGKKEEQFFSTPKSVASERELIVDDKTLELLKKWKFYQSKSKVFSLVFSHDGEFLSTKKVYNDFKKIQKKYSLPSISVHDLRHSHASMLVFLGENPKAIQERLGHENIEMTLGVYSHLYPSQNLKLVSKLNQVL